MYVPVCRLTGHSADVVRGRVSPDMMSVTSASVDKSLLVWDTASASPLRTLGGHDGEISDLCYHDSSNGIFTSCFDGKTRLFDLRSSTSMEPALVLGGEGELTCVASGNSINSPHLITGDTRGFIRFFDIRQNRACVTSFSHYNSVCSVEVSPDDSMIVSSSVDTTVRIFSSAKGDCLMTVNNGEIHPSPAVYATFLSNNEGVVGLFTNSSIVTYHLSDRVYPKRRMPSPNVGVSTKTICSIPSESNLYAVPSSDGMVHFLNVATGESAQPARKAHADDVLSVDVRGRVMVSTSGGEDSSGVLWVQTDVDLQDKEYTVSYHLVCPQIEGLVYIFLIHSCTVHWNR